MKKFIFQSHFFYFSKLWGVKICSTLKKIPSEFIQNFEIGGGFSSKDTVHRAWTGKREQIYKVMTNFKMSELIKSTVRTSDRPIIVFLIYKNPYKSVRTKYINNPREYGQVTEKEVYLYKNIK